jgi:hypothetical protein
VGDVLLDTRVISYSHSALYGAQEIRDFPFFALLRGEVFGLRKTALVLASVALAVLLASGVAWAATVQCEPGSLYGEPCEGTPRDDVIRGTHGNDRIFGWGGRDTIYGREGRDALYGLTSNDWLSGGPDGDNINGGQGDDVSYGGVGNDSLDTGSHSGDDEQYGQGGADELFGGTGADVLDGGPGNDDMRGRGDTDRRDIDHLFGRDGDDTIYTTERPKNGEDIDVKDFVSCGAGNDTVIADDQLDVVGEGCENVTFEP